MGVVQAASAGGGAGHTDRGGRCQTTRRRPPEAPRRQAPLPPSHPSHPATHLRLSQYMRAVKPSVARVTPSTRIWSGSSALTRAGKVSRGSAKTLALTTWLMALTPLSVRAARDHLTCGRAVAEGAGGWGRSRRGAKHGAAAQARS
jgi:hypothetical protein